MLLPNPMQRHFSKVLSLKIKLGPIVSSAYWIGANFITYDSQKVVADYGKRYQLLALRELGRLLFDEVEVSEENRRKLNL